MVRESTPKPEYSEPEELINEIHDVFGAKRVYLIIQRFLDDYLIEILKDVRPRLLERGEWIEIRIKIGEVAR